MNRFILWLLRPEWVAFTTEGQGLPELGLRIWGVTFSLYKADVIAYSDAELDSARAPMKREFGESLHPI